MRLRPNDCIGVYRIVRPLGKGGMGAVYEVVHVKLGVHYALKTFTLDHGHVKLLKERFLAEGRILARLGARDETEDVAQEIFLKLVDVLRQGRYHADAGKFRCYVAAMIRREIVSQWRKAQVRGGAENIPLDELEADEELAVPPAQAAVIDAKWRLARHEAAVEHALTKTALSARSRDIYRAYVLEECPIDEVAARFGVTKNHIGQIKLRVSRMIAALEAGFGVDSW